MTKRLIRSVLLIICTACLAVVVGTLVPRPLWTGTAAFSSAHSTRQILVLSNPIHTDIAIPVDAALAARFGFLADGGIVLDGPGVAYVVFGWGGRAFYIETPAWSDLKPMPVLKALTLDRSVMHVAVAGGINPAHPAVMPIAIGDVAYVRLLQFIEDSFERDGQAALPIAGAAYGQNDAFFEAKGSFNALAGCNTWTAAALRQAGLATGWWNPLPATLVLSLRLHNDLPPRQH